MSQDIHQELEAIAVMLNEADKYGLTAEVVLSLSHILKDGETDIAKAANMALMDWDI